eukprot:CAMPEP_0174693718 /NCGR_PEP_ID=MMETSP1094-20130205/357_1 /TAXON_ID=156173 /ORGANISM="Chrysochromulina brevifilum, Strain UTEX LB 985" /LENGTH=185 /DNA_ID=CAMNT_0015889701 /DNA_START=114 /DNA_END=671 /DNA_ORIENTATION=+
MVMDALSDALCRFLDTHYFAPDLSHDDIFTNTKQEEFYMDDDIATSKKGGKGIEEAEEDIFMPEHISADIKLAAYERVILETPLIDLEVAEVCITPRETVVAKETPAVVPSQPAPVEAPKAPKKAGKGKKAAKKAKSPKAAAAMPRAIAANAGASSSAKSKAAPLLRNKLTPARKAGAKPAAVRV